jgi:oligopeptide/dipeptide ABC transporter ATP-binding protein
VNPLLAARNLCVRFPIAGGLWGKTMGHVHAVQDVSLQVFPGEIVALVGESGCGKTTLGFSLLGLQTPTSGAIELLGHALDIRKPRAWKPYRKDFQIVFQDPYTALNPRLTVFELLAEPLRVHGLVPAKDLRGAAVELLGQVGLEADVLDRFPHAFSGGQRQRLCIARALGLKPKLLVCDEVVSALDVSVQAQIVNLLVELRRKHGLALLFITHDLSLVRSVADRVLVMYLGRIVESAPAGALFHSPRHPYTRALIESIPTLDRARRPRPLGGEIPSAANPPPGCAFAGRCDRVLDRCRSEVPALAGEEERAVACFNPVVQS